MPKDRSPRRRPETQSHHPRDLAEAFRWSVPWRWVFTVVPLLLVAGVTYAALNSSLLSVQEVKVEGTRSLDQASLAQISGLRGKSMLTLPEDAARRRLLAIPAVRSVSITREWPNAITITVDERDACRLLVRRRPRLPRRPGRCRAQLPARPMARRRASSRSRQGRVWSRATACTRTPSRLPSASWPSRRASWARASQSWNTEAGVGVTAVFDGGLRVTFGDERSYDYKIAVLSALLDQLDSKGIQPTAVDLRFGERVTYE